MTTYYVEAFVTSKGELIQDMGLTAEQVDYLRDAEARGVISGLIVREDIDVVSAFSTPAVIN